MKLFAMASLFALLVCAYLAAPTNSAAAAETVNDTTWQYVRIIGVADDQTSIDVEVAPFNTCSPSKDTGTPTPCKQLHLVVKDDVVKARVKLLQRGDRINVTFIYGENNQNSLKSFCLATAPPVLPFTRFWVLFTSALISFLIYYLWSSLRPLNLLIGEDGRYSNSKFQIALWFFTLITTYVSVVILRIWYAGCDFVGGVNIPQNLLLISGMSVLTFAGAKAITTSKVNALKESSNSEEDPKNSAGVTPNFFQDLTHNDGGPGKAPKLDFGDFQMLIVTLIAVGTYLGPVFSFLGTIVASKVIMLPDVDTTILAVFGLGQGAYLTKKAAGNLGDS